MIVTLARNVTTGRYHPFIWREAPMPGSDPQNKVQRFKSKAHHTMGFETEAEARAELPNVEQAAIRMDGRATLRVDAVVDMEWAPDEVPATVMWMKAE